MTAIATIGRPTVRTSFAGMYIPASPSCREAMPRTPSLNLRLDWMRADRSRELAVGSLSESSRKIDPISSITIRSIATGRLSTSSWRAGKSTRFVSPKPDDVANPYESPEKLAETLREFLAPLELTFVFEYLYARFSLRNPDEVKNDEQLAGALTLAREYLLLIAVSEMQHLRWDNEILWELYRGGIVIKGYDTVIKLARLVPAGTGRSPLQDQRGSQRRQAHSRQRLRAYVKFKHADRVSSGRSIDGAHTKGTATELQEGNPHVDPGAWRKRALRLLTRKVQQEFINIERPAPSLIGPTPASLLPWTSPVRYPRCTWRDSLGGSSATACNMKAVSMRSRLRWRRSRKKVNISEP